MKYLKNCKAVLLITSLDDAVIAMEDGQIAGIYPAAKAKIPENAEIIDGQGLFAGPGYVDMHCHGGGVYKSHTDPEGVAKHHLQGGTTTMNLTLYHSFGHEVECRMMETVRRLKAEGKLPNVNGVHLEGPYLSRQYGAHPETARDICREEYTKTIQDYGDIIRLWTVSPELEGAAGFISAAAGAGIVVAIGHSAASLEQIDQAVDLGATVCTHIADATGGPILPCRQGGTIECDFNVGVMLRDEVFCEMINDSMGRHVRHAMTRFITKAVGIDRVCGITDCEVNTNGSTLDVNLYEGTKLAGSFLTMEAVARNFSRNTCLSMTEVFRVCSYNPARALRISHEVGSLAVGKRANLVLINENYDLHGVILDGSVVVKK